MSGDEEDGRKSYQRRADDETVKERCRDPEPPARVLEPI